VDRLVLVTTSPRVGPGLFGWSAWQELHAGHVCLAEPDHPQLAALAAAGVPVEVMTVGSGWPDLARRFRSRAVGGRAAVWLAAPGGDPDLARELGDLVTRELGDGVEIQVVPGSFDLPGARLLDVVATMDRLRSPGGCPWDAEQTHSSLAPYLLEEAYEAVDAIERADGAALRDELGDVLLQVAFHARLAEEGEDLWTIDDVAAGLVDKLVRRHPHVFAGRPVAGVPDVLANWDTIKAAEEGRSSPLAAVSMGAPALALAAKLQQRAAAFGLPPAPVSGDAVPVETVSQFVVRAAAVLGEDPDGPMEAVGDLLFAVVALARFHNVDPEAALRGTTRRFRDHMLAMDS